jgi:hypothetical protein
MNWFGVLVIIVNCVVRTTGFVGINSLNGIKLRNGINVNMCANNNFADCQYITGIIPVVPNKTKISYITNDINYEIVVSVYSTYNNKNTLMFLNNGSYIEIYNKTVIYDTDKLQQNNIVSQAFYNRIIEYIRKNITDV